jgi:hypothetical protein
MHLLIPFAAPMSDAGQQALASTPLPNLKTLLNTLVPQGGAADDMADEWSPNPPHERALARALGWQGQAGALPFAARQAVADGVDVGDLAWGLLTPAHWHVGTDQVSLLDPALLLLDETTSLALYEAVRLLFVEEGFVVHWGAPLRWYVAHESLAGLPCASLDRVIGRNVDAWLGSDTRLRRVRRLQAEVQMLLHTHPVNEGREARGLPVVNSFWLSGCGVWQPDGAPAPAVDDRLRTPALRADWPGWCRAWQTLDDGPLAELVARVQGRRSADDVLTLCGERGSLTWQAGPRGWRERWQALWRPLTPQQVMAGL